MKLKERIASSAANILVRKPGTIFIVLLVLIVLSLVSASRLTINTNQLDLISQRIVEIKDLKRAINMLGGVGHLLLALRGDDEEKLKKVSDDIYERFVKDKKNFRKITYKVDVSFAKSRVSMFVKTPDLKEVRKRVMLKLNDVLRRSDPFFFEIEETKPYKLKLEHIVQKYRKVGKKSITDDYYISQDRHMILLIIKPMWDANQLGKTGTLLKKIRTDLAAYTKSNKHGIKLMEDYSFAPDKNKSVIEYGFTGSYKTNYDDSFSIRNSLLPTSGFAIIGILLVLLIFLRRNFGAVVLVLSGLLVGILLTFGYAYVTIGQLNMITSILAGILMGQGIDFGIHFIYRIREELGRQDSVEEAVRLTVINSGIASFVSATAIGAAFFALCFSEFRGFSQFGFLAGSGVFLIGLVLYTWVPGILLLLARWKPELPKKIVGTLPPIEANKSGEEKRIPRPRLILAIAGVVILSVVSFAPKVYFNYNSRALMVENQPSVVLQDEIDRRFQISADPVAVFAKDLKEAKKLYKELTNKPKKYDTIDQVVSLYTFIPPYKQQVANAKILKAWEKEILAKGIKVASLPPKFRKRYPEMLKHLRTQHF